MRHAATLSPPQSTSCAYLPSRRGCTLIPFHSSRVTPSPRCLRVSVSLWQIPCSQQFAASLSSLCPLFCTPFLCFQPLAASFCKTPGVGVSWPIPTFRHSYLQTLRRYLLRQFAANSPCISGISRLNLSGLSRLLAPGNLSRRRRAHGHLGLEGLPHLRTHLYPYSPFFRGARRAHRLEPAQIGRA